MNVTVWKLLVSRKKQHKHVGRAANMKLCLSLQSASCHMSKKQQRQFESVHDGEHIRALLNDSNSHKQHTKNKRQICSILFFFFFWSYSTLPGLLIFFANNHDVCVLGGCIYRRSGQEVPRNKLHNWQTFHWSDLLHMHIECPIGNTCRIY